LIGFTLAVPSIDKASHDPTPLLYIIGSYFPNYVVVAALVFVSIAIFASVLANLTTLTRLVWSMARDGQLPASRFLSKVSVHKVPANAIWVVIPITAIFTIWAQVEVVIIAICTFTMYVTYGMVVCAVLWGKNQRSDQRDMQERKKVSRGLCFAALAWLASITGLLTFMTAMSMSRTALLETAVATGAVFIFVLGYWLLRKSRRSPAVQLAEEE
jgi:amino acid transporter